MWIAKMTRHQEPCIQLIAHRLEGKVSRGIADLGETDPGPVGTLPLLVGMGLTALRIGRDPAVRSSPTEQTARHPRPGDLPRQAGIGRLPEDVDADLVADG